jgi:hypothetical protein
MQIMEIFFSEYFKRLFLHFPSQIKFSLDFFFGWGEISTFLEKYNLGQSRQGYILRFVKFG